MQLQLSGEAEYPFQTEIFIIAGFLFLKGWADESWSNQHLGSGLRQLHFNWLGTHAWWKFLKVTPQSKHFKENNPCCMPECCKHARIHMRETDERKVNPNLKALSLTIYDSKCLIMLIFFIFPQWLICRLCKMSFCYFKWLDGCELLLFICFCVLMELFLKERRLSKHYGRGL